MINCQMYNRINYHATAVVQSAIKSIAFKNKDIEKKEDSTTIFKKISGIDGKDVIGLQAHTDNVLNVVSVFENLNQVKAHQAKLDGLIDAQFQEIWNKSEDLQDTV